jgi:hypothetical protein
MHTSTRLAAADFQYWRRSREGDAQLSFADFCPNYHELDRVGVVSPCLEDGVLFVGRTLLALTTAFYDSQRARSTDFFDYPQHFAFVNAIGEGVQSDSHGTAPNAAETWEAWSWLDVWPDNKWITAPPTATGLLQKVFDFQINRLFWPRGLVPAPGEQGLPAYTYRMLRTHLKSVYQYTSGTPAPEESATIELRVSPAANELWQESIGRLPNPPSQSAFSAVERFEPIDIDNFLSAVKPAKP